MELIEQLDVSLRLAAFNLYSHNRDDHSKNISFLKNAVVEWKLAPAYDLTFSNSSHGMHSTMIAGESKAPGQQHLLELANTFDVKNPTAIIDEVKSAISDWQVYAKDYFVSRDSQKLITKVLTEIRKR